MKVSLLLPSGGTNLRSMNSQKIIPEACLAACGRLNIEPTQFVLTVNISQQTVSLFENNRFLNKMPASTSCFGFGEIQDSNCTPRGLHRIAEKIGAGEPAGTVFKSRKVIGYTSQPEFADAKITTRILWLEGLEPGFNLIKAAMWIRTPATFTSTARVTRNPSANRPRRAAFIWPMRI